MKGIGYGIKDFLRLYTFAFRDAWRDFFRKGFEDGEAVIGNDFRWQKNTSFRCHFTK